MPIIDIGESKQVEFGHGDVAISPGMLKDTKIGVVVFRNQEAKPIGHYVKHEPNQEMDIDETPVRFTFEKIESIDVVIRTLEETKKLMEAAE